MTSSEVPERCIPPTCKAVLANLDGYVKFPRDVISYDVVHYICAKASETIIMKGTHTETLQEMKACSNGFIIDNTAPAGGELYVNDVNGYIADLQNLEIMWYGFGDNANVAALGYDNKINSYTVAIGR